MVRTAAETFFYNFNESKFFRDERILRVAPTVCTISQPPIDHLRIIDELYRGAQIYMTLYPQKPGTYFGAEICKCQWDCHRRAPVVEDAPVVNEKKKPTESPKLGFSSLTKVNKRGSALEAVTGDEPPAEFPGSLPEKVLRMKKNVEERVQNVPSAPPRKSQSLPGRADFGMTTANHAENPSRLQTEESKKTADKTLRMKNQKGADPTPLPQNPTADGATKIGRSASRVTLPAAALAPTETPLNPERIKTSESQVLAKRRTTWGFLDVNTTPQSRTRASLQQRPASPVSTQGRASSPKKSQFGDGLPNHCRKCTEKLCLKCRMPVDSCCCGIPNFLYCTECEENIAGAAKNVGDPFKCRKCDQKLCLVCRQHIDNCCCPKPNFFVCRSCETRRRTRCCIPVQR